jgi:histidinol phosphatase-like PHP family hydrolase
MVRALEEKLGMKLNVSPDSHFVGALGASIFALERAAKGVASSESAVSSQTSNLGTENPKLETRNLDKEA